MKDVDRQSDAEKEPSGGRAAADRDFEVYKLLLELWAAENPIKTNKLQVLLAANAILISATGVAGGLTADKWYIYVAGAVFCLVWTLSIGRTALFQKAWQIKLDQLRQRHPEDARFTILETSEAEKRARPILRLLGGVSSKWYLLFSPLVFALAWIVVLLVTIL
ncbi:MAG TPA: hypothetical protein VN285_10955 [Candidatus Deferrimicrobium sp.]|nr:hypothetical protein [Candidatus Deferrimicrobium sp.]